MNDMVEMIRIEGLSKSYGDVPVLRNCSLERRSSGEVVVVCGPSGSGKIDR
jgi:glutamate/aspartate transport system ATP-binding protein